jgi:hypothetical protein
MLAGLFRSKSGGDESGRLYSIMDNSFPVGWAVWAWLTSETTNRQCTLRPVFRMVLLFSMSLQAIIVATKVTSCYDRQMNRLISSSALSTRSSQLTFIAFNLPFHNDFRFVMRVGHDPAFPEKVALQRTRLLVCGRAQADFLYIDWLPR